MTDLRNDFPAGVLTGQDVTDVFTLAKANRFALPAANCIGSSSANAVMETAGALNSPVILQFSNGGAAFNAGKGVPLAGIDASVVGSIAAAHHIRTVAPYYGARVILHTDHAAKKLLPWIDGMLDEGEKYFDANGVSLYSSHMLDLSEESMEENIDISCRYLERMAKMDMTLEIELGITGGEEDGVDNENVDTADLYSTRGGRLRIPRTTEGQPSLHCRRRLRQRARRVQAWQRRADTHHFARRTGPCGPEVWHL